MTIPPDKRDLVRAIPREGSDACARVLIRVGAIVSNSFGGHRGSDGAWVSETSAMKDVEAETLVIAGVAPRGAAPAPAGVQFSTFDDVVLSTFKGGEVAELTMRTWRAPYATHVTMETCDEHRDMIDFPDEKLDGELGKVSECRPIRFELRPRPSPGFGGQSIEAELIAIGALPP